MIKIGILADDKQGVNPEFVDGVIKKDNVSTTKGKATHETIVAKIIKDILDKNKVKYELVEFRNTYGGMRDAIDYGCDILNVSYNVISGVRSVVYPACNEILVVTSAGNQGAKGETTLAEYDNVIAVGAVDKSGNHLDFSSWGNGGVDVACLGEHDLFGKVHRGTSYACPVAVGILATLLYHKPEYKFNDVMSYIKTFAIDVEDEGVDLKTGFGWLDKYYPYDIQGHWAREVLMKSVKTGILLGYEDGSLKPDEMLTRAESITINSRFEERMESTIEKIVRKVLSERE